MSNQLLESIINKDFISAESYFHDRLGDIMEQKLYEKKRQVAAELDEVLGGLSKQDIADRRARGYVKATDVLGDPDVVNKLPFLGRKSDGSVSKVERKVEPKKKTKEKKPLSSKAVQRKFKKRVKELKEAVVPAVQPDPEGKVGSPKAKKSGVISSIKRLLTKSKGLGKGAMIAHKMTPSQRAEYQKLHAQRRAEKRSGTDSWETAAKKTAGAEPSDTKTTTRDSNLVTPSQKFRNALMGREIDHTPAKMSDTERKNKRPGLAGVAGKALRGGLKGLESGLHSLEEQEG